MSAPKIYEINNYRLQNHTKYRIVPPKAEALRSSLYIFCFLFFIFTSPYFFMPPFESRNSALECFSEFPWSEFRIEFKRIIQLQQHTTNGTKYENGIINLFRSHNSFTKTILPTARNWLHLLKP